MHVQTTVLALFGLLASQARSEMKLTSPPPITKFGREGPCDKMDPHDRTHVEEWPVNGHDVGLVFSEANTYVTLEATVINEGSLYDFRDLRPRIHIHRADDYCFMRIRGVKEWIGKPALFQAKQYTPGVGYNFTCAAIKFVKGGPHKPTCRGFHEQLVDAVAHPLDGPPLEEGNGEIKYIEADE
ncbi:hypothetical protein PG996_010198 [Apiospora saccharicola]|uniref:Copper acquisition factor BIM1-like domain-containing protein n=1 Tax=Apiospora saccharicola TaxID=335842 RepID=A0ABR1UMV8_9PEZI